MDMVPQPDHVDTDRKNITTGPLYSKQTLQAISEARHISKDSSVPGYTSMEELKETLEK